MEISLSHSHNPTLFDSLSESPSTSMLNSFSPLPHVDDDILNGLNPTILDDDWMKPLLFEHDFLSSEISNDDIENEQEKHQVNEIKSFNNDSLFLTNENFLSNNYSQQQAENEFVDCFQQQLPSTTAHLIHQPKIELTELCMNEQFLPIVTNSKTIEHTYTTSTSSVPNVSAKVLKGKKFRRNNRISTRTTSRNNATIKRRLNSTKTEPKASVVIVAEDATRIDSKTTTLGLSSTSSCSDLVLKSSSTTRSSNRRRIKSTPREVILFRNGTLISKEPITKQQSISTCYETTTNNSSLLHQQQITATDLQAAAQILTCNVLRQATLNENDKDALVEQLIKRHRDDNFPFYCDSNPSSCLMTPIIDDYENNCSTALKILGCDATTSLHLPTSATVELLTLAALQQQNQTQICYIKQEPTATFLLPRLVLQ